MDEAILQRVAADPRYHDLVRRRSRFAWVLAAIVFFAFVGFTCVVALDKQLLGTRIGGHATSWGIPAGFGMIVLAVVSIAIFSRRSAKSFDPAMQEILAEAGE